MIIRENDYHRSIRKMTCLPYSILVLILEPLDDSPARRLHADVLVVLDTRLALRVCLPVARSLVSHTRTSASVYKQADQQQDPHSLVEVRQLDQDHALDRHEHLQQRRLGRPLFLRPSSRIAFVRHTFLDTYVEDAPPCPRPEERQAHLAVVVQVRVEPHRPAAGRAEMHERRLVRVLDRDEAVELEQPPGVRRPFGSCDHDLAAKLAERRCRGDATTMWRSPRMSDGVCMSCVRWQRRAAPRHNHVKNRDVNGELQQQRGKQTTRSQLRSISRSPRIYISIALFGSEVNP